MYTAMLASYNNFMYIVGNRIAEIKERKYVHEMNSFMMNSNWNQKWYSWAQYLNNTINICCIQTAWFVLLYAVCDFLINMDVYIRICTKLQ